MTTAPPKAPPLTPSASAKFPPLAPPAPEQTCQPRKFTVAEYYRLAEVGILQPDERVELIKGEIVLMAPIGHLHGSGVDRLTLPFAEVSRGRFIVRTQGAIRLGEHSEPEPDLALLVFREDYYAGFQPGPDDILAVVEVSDTTLAYDREVKSKLYAAAGIPEMLLMNLPEDCLEHSTNPGPDGYARHIIYRRGDKIRLLALPDLELAVADLLPPLPADEEPHQGPTS